MRRVIVGPTGAGKSGLAMALAEHRQITICSADSRQIYRGFDIGTAKPSASDRVRVPHEGIDICEPTDRFSAFEWAAACRVWEMRAIEGDRTPVIVGGTGFYIRALVAPLDALPTLGEAPREALASWLQTLPSEEIRRWCARLDPARADAGRAQQCRAIETALLAGVRLSDHFGVAAARTPPESARYLVVDPGVAMGERIVSRVDAMLAAGWRDEVASLADTIPADAPAWKASGYGTLREHVRGALTLNAARERIIIETRQYAKRQRTWWRHQLPHWAVTYLDSTQSDAVATAVAWWDHEPDVRVTQ